MLHGFGVFMFESLMLLKRFSIWRTTITKLVASVHLLERSSCLCSRRLNPLIFRRLKGYFCPSQKHSHVKIIILAVFNGLLNFILKFLSLHLFDPILLRLSWIAFLAKDLRHFSSGYWFNLCNNFFIKNPPLIFLLSYFKLFCIIYLFEDVFCVITLYFLFGHHLYRFKLSRYCWFLLKYKLHLLLFFLILLMM